MKVATILNPESTLGAEQFVIVSNDLATCRPAKTSSFQAALDQDGASPDGDEQLFSVGDALAPLPRAFQFLDASAYVNHVALVRQARGAEMPAEFWIDPLMYQGVSDPMLGAQADIVGDPEWGLDFEAEVAVITHHIAQGASADEAAEAIRYVLLMNDISLRALIPQELAKGFGFVQSKPPSAFSPVAVSVDDCPGWDGRKMHGTMLVNLNGIPFGRIETGEDMTFDFGTLLSHAAKTRPLGVGTILGSGTISNRDASGGPGKTVAQGGAGYGCIAEQRMIETINEGAPKTPFLQSGDSVDIWMEDDTGQNIFGTISQKVRAL